MGQNEPFWHFPHTRSMYGIPYICNILFLLRNVTNPRTGCNIGLHVTSDEGVCTIPLLQVTRDFVTEKLMLQVYEGFCNISGTVQNVTSVTFKTHKDTAKPRKTELNRERHLTNHRKVCYKYGQGGQQTW